MKAIETENLTKYYSRGTIKALDDLTLSVDRGTVFSLLGPNGAGKTTMIKLLLGLVHPTRGNARLLDHDCGSIKNHENIGYLAENHRFPEFFSAYQTLFYFGQMQGLDRPFLRKQILKVLSMVNLEKWAQSKTGKFSKGMLQRLGLAHALLHDPELIFLDEPTDGIDPMGRREIRDLLGQLRDQGKTIFLNSHLLSEVERISDEVAILKNGTMVRKGRVDDLVKLEKQYQFLISEHKEIFDSLCLQAGIPIINEDKGYLITVKDEQQLNWLIEQLLQHKILIQGIIPKRISLEDYFIQVIEED